MLRAQNFPNDVLAGLDNFDFSKTKDVEFVHSIPGTYSSQEEIVRTGLPSLANAVRAAIGGNLAGDKVNIEYATSSVGSLDEMQVTTFVQALGGRNPFDTLRRNGETHDEEGDLKIVFPTKSTVQNSRGGLDVSPLHFLQAIRLASHVLLLC